MGETVGTYFVAGPYRYNGTRHGRFELVMLVPVIRTQGHLDCFRDEIESKLLKRPKHFSITDFEIQTLSRI